MNMMIPSLEDFGNGNVSKNWKMCSVKNIIHVVFEEEIEMDFFHFIRIHDFKYISETVKENERIFKVMISIKDTTFEGARKRVEDILRRLLQLKLMFSEINDQKQFKKFR